MDLYSAFFCEENIWHLARAEQSADRYALLFFNAFGQIAVRQQKVFEAAATGCWDYHVVLLDAGQALVYDYDTRLGSPVDAQRYLRQTFPPQQSLPLQFRSLARVVPAREYARHFSSDRSHMLDADGAALAPFPDWPAILSAEPIHLQQYTSDARIAGSASIVLPVETLAADIASGELARQVASESRNDS